MSKFDSKIIVALDFPTQRKALNCIQQLDPELCRVKIGKQLFTHYGPVLLEKIHQQGFEIFLDLKFHDIPNTVAAACRVVAELGVWMINVHSLGGRAMMEAAREALDLVSGKKPWLIGVTVLTSMSQADLLEVGITLSVEQQVLKLAQLTQQSSLDGVVCSAQEAKILRQQLPKEFCLVTPGIRPESSDSRDQKRVMTPQQAIMSGVDYMVIGRPITQAEDPLEALLAIHKSS